MADDQAPPRPPPAPVEPQLTPRDLAVLARALTQCLRRPQKVVIHAPGKRRGP